MNILVKIFLFLAVILSFPVFASASYRCLEVYGTAMDYKSDSANDLRIEIDGSKANNGSILTFTKLGNSRAYLEGNQGESILVHVYGDQYLEKTGIGIVAWTFFSNIPDKNYQLLISQKSYMFISIPMAYTTVYKCYPK